MIKSRKGVVNGKWDPLYQAWRQMKGRCNNPNKPDYPYYGGKGVAFFPAWDHYDAFAAANGPHPGAGWTLDRIDNTRGYEPGNVRWATRLTQSRNRPYCRISLSAKRQIVDLWKAGVRQVDIAAAYDIAQTRVSQIVRGL